MQRPSAQRWRPGPASDGSSPRWTRPRRSGPSRTWSSRPPCFATSSPAPTAPCSNRWSCCLSWCRTASWTEASPGSSRAHPDSPRTCRWLRGRAVLPSGPSWSSWHRAGCVRPCRSCAAPRSATRRGRRSTDRAPCRRCSTTRPPSGTPRGRTPGTPLQRERCWRRSVMQASGHPTPSGRCCPRACTGRPCRAGRPTASCTTPRPASRRRGGAAASSSCPSARRRRGRRSMSQV
mmetsp:Transcript_100627/g.319697  ORF Transcript_100627/g.319697 Transcript_100627/m.319697 type:complete len:234 (-) Transcript_100627:53-754(-)